MRDIYIVMMAICGTISYMLFDDTAAFLGWLSATMAYGLAAMERS
jgi:hypothetical protein